MDELSIILGAELDLKRVEEQIAELKNKKDYEIKLTANVDEVKKKIADLQKYGSTKANAPKITIDVNRNESRANIKNFVDSIRNGYEKSPIKLSFGVDLKASQANIKSFIDQLQNQVVNLKVNPTVNPNNGGANNGNQSGAGGGNNTGSSLPAWNRIPGMKKVRDELNQVVTNYVQDLTSKGATKISSSVSATYEKDGTPNYKGLVQYQTAVGETVNAVLQLDKATNVWRVSSTSVSKNYAAQAKEIEKVNAQIQKEEQHTRDFLSTQKSLMDDSYTKAFQLTNPLKGQFKDEYDRVFKEWQDEYNKIGTRITKDQENRLVELQKRTERTFQIQSKAQSGATTLAKKDVTSEVEIRKNDIDAEIDKLNRLGIVSGDVRDRFDNLKNSVNSITDIQGLQTWNAQFKEAESALKRFEQSAEGMGQRLANSLSENQLSQIGNIQNTLNNLDQSLSGAGVENLQQRLQQLKISYEDIQKQLNTPNLSDNQYKALAEQLKTLDNQLKQAANAAKIFDEGFKNEKAIEKYKNTVDTLQKSLELLRQKYDIFVKNNPGKASTEAETAMQNFEEALRNVDPTDVDVLSKSFTNVTATVNNAIGPTQTLSSILQQNFGAVGSLIARFASGYAILNKTISVIKSMVTEVRSLDSSLVELQKVTSLTGQSLSDFTDKAYDIGKGLGRTGQDVIDAVTTFSRAGYDLNEATDLAKSALTMTNVGVDIPNIESAASDMISILKAYDKQADESMQVIDKLYNVANKEPLDFGDITDMLVTAGGTLAQTGTSLEETMGLLTGAFATMRDKSVSNG